MSFKRKSSDRSVENTSGADDRAPESEVEMLFELFCKYFEKTFDEHNKRMESKLYCDAMQGKSRKVQAFQTRARNQIQIQRICSNILLSIIALV